MLQTLSRPFFDKRVAQEIPRDTRLKELIDKFKAPIFNGILAISLLFYMILGAVIFNLLEQKNHLRENEEQKQRVVECFKMQVRYANDSMPQWTAALAKRMYQECLLENFTSSNWTLAKSFVIGFSTFTTIGCNSLTLKSSTSQVIYLITSIIGLPAMLLFLANIGQFMRDALYTIHVRSTKRIRERLTDVIWPILTPQRKDHLFQKFKYDPVEAKRRRYQKKIAKLNWSPDEHFDPTMNPKPEILNEEEEVIDSQEITREHSLIGSLHTTFVMSTSDMGVITNFHPLVIFMCLIYICVGVSLTTIAIEAGSASVRVLHAVGHPVASADEAKTSRIWIGGEQTNVLNLVRSMGDSYKIDPVKMDNIDFRELAISAVQSFESGIPIILPDEVSNRESPLQRIIEQTTRVESAPSKAEVQSVEVLDEQRRMERNPIEFYESGEAPMKNPLSASLVDEDFPLETREFSNFLSTRTNPDPKSIERFLTFQPNRNNDLRNLRTRGTFIATLECSPRTGLRTTSDFETLKSDLNNYTGELLKTKPITRAVSDVSLNIPYVSDGMQVYRIKSVTSLHDPIPGTLFGVEVMDSTSVMKTVIDTPRQEPGRVTHQQHDFVAQSVRLPYVPNMSSEESLTAQEYQTAPWNWRFMTPVRSMQTVTRSIRVKGQRRRAPINIPIRHEIDEFRTAVFHVEDSEDLDMESPSYSAFIQVIEPVPLHQASYGRPRGKKSIAETTEMTFVNLHNRLASKNLKGVDRKQALIALYQREWAKSNAKQPGKSTGAVARGGGRGNGRGTATVPSSRKVSAPPLLSTPQTSRSQSGPTSPSTPISPNSSRGFRAESDD